MLGCGGASGSPDASRHDAAALVADAAACGQADFPDLGIGGCYPTGQSCSDGGYEIYCHAMSPDVQGTPPANCTEGSATPGGFTNCCPCQ